MITTHEIYVHPYPITTAAATLITDKTDAQSQEVHAWENKKTGEYLYLYPYWYVWDEQGKLLLVGKSDKKPKNDRVYYSDDDDIRLELELMINMPLDQRLTIASVVMNSMIVFTSDPEEPAHMFHPGSHVAVARHLYKVDKKGVLRHVGKLHSEYRRELINQSLLMMGVPDTCDVNIAPDYEWKARKPYEEHVSKPETKEEITQYMMEGFRHHLKERGKQPEVGDHFTVESPEGYKLEAYCLPADDTDPVHPVHGKPAYKMAVRIYNPDGTSLFEQ